MSVDTEVCPECGEDSGIVMGWGTLGESLVCKSCSQALTVEYDESYIDGEESQHWWVTIDRYPEKKE